MSQKRFNIRVYGIWIHEGKVLVNEEMIKGRQITKFPGGGLEWGEGIADCLKREWMEELGLDIDLLDHFYTTDFFQPSAFDDSQVISIYYFVAAKNIPERIVNHMENERSIWLDIAQMHAGLFQLPIDRKVGELLARYVQSSLL